MTDDNILYQTIFNESKEFIFAIDTPESFLFKNEKFKNLGYTKLEYDQLKPAQIFSEKDFNNIVGYLKEDGFKSTQEITQLLKKDGNPITIRSEIKKHGFNDKKILILRGDLNKDQKLEKQKRVDSIYSWENIANTLPYEVVICDLNFIINYSNKTSLKDGISFRGTSYLDYSNNVPKKLVQNVLEKATKGKQGNLSYFLQLANGERKWYEKQVYPLYSKKAIYAILAITQDITAQKEIEKKQKQNEDNFKKIVENANDIVYTCDAQGNFTYINPLGLKITGYSEKKLIGKNYFEFIREDFLITAKAFYRYQLENKIPSTYYEFPFVSKEGVEYWLGQSVQLRIKDDKVLSIQAVARDITTRKKIEKELLEAKVLAEESLKAKEQFLSIMSHEIRTPLNAVVGLSNLLISEKHTEDQKEYLNGLKYSSDNLLSVINDVLDFSKIESGKIYLENIDFNLENLLKRVQDITRVAAIKKGLDVDLTIDPTIPKYVKGDPIRLNQILTNLVSNAIKFTEKGTIELIIYNKKEKQSAVEIQFVIKDTGIGIENKRIKYIFDPFTQASSETTRKYGGSGLGLTISKKLIDLMNGKITVDSKVNSGSKFKVSILFDKIMGDISHIENKESISLSDLPKTLNLLVVEDNEMNQLVIQKNLDAWKIDHTQAFDGKEALEIVLQRRFDLILLDLEMPKMNGYELSKQIRSNAIDTPIIAISATSNPKSINLALSNGANDFLSKPIDNKLLISKIIEHTSLDKKLEFKTVKKQVNIPKKTTGKLINLNYLINSSAGDTVFIEKMINSFIINTPGYLKRFNKFYELGKLEDLRTEAHKFKATISIMGIDSVKKQIEKLESIIESGKKTKEIPQLLKGIEKDSNLACKEAATVLTKSI